MHRLETFESDVITVPVNATCVDVADELDAQSVGCVVVMDGKRVAGILTDRDLTCRVVASDRDPAKTTAGEVMTPDPITATREHDLADVLGLMRERSVRRIPLVEDGELVGVVSLDDVIVRVASYLFNTNQGLLGGLHHSRRTTRTRRRREAREEAFDELREQLEHMGDEVRELVRTQLDELVARVGRRR